MRQPGGYGELIPQMPEHMGCSIGTSKMVFDACTAWLERRGMNKSLHQLRDEGLARRRAMIAKKKKARVKS